MLLGAVALLVADGVPVRAATAGVSSADPDAPVAGEPFTIRGAVFDEESDEPVAGVSVTLLDASEAPVGNDVTDAHGAFTIVGEGAGDYTVSFRHVAYADYHSDRLEVAEHETVTLDVRLARTDYVLDPLTVVARATPHRHEASYGGLYAHIPRETARVGGNRILVKGDWELDLGLSAGDILERVFPRIRAGRSGLCVYWNGFLVQRPMMEARLQTHVDDLEAMEVYSDYLRAPLSMWGPPPGTLATTCSAVVALWALRPDLPGREPR